MSRNKTSQLRVSPEYVAKADALKAVLGLSTKQLAVEAAIDALLDAKTGRAFVGSASGPLFIPEDQRNLLVVICAVLGRVVDEREWPKTADEAFALLPELARKILSSK